MLNKIVGTKEPMFQTRRRVKMRNTKIYQDRQRGPEVHSHHSVVGQEPRERQEGQEELEQLRGARSPEKVRVESHQVAVSRRVEKVSYKDWETEWKTTSEEMKMKNRDLER